ncbi:MAG: hypothetical protein KIT60_07025 [Burkholderiaceae bacterium]|nr:hypothetical protein [Burkholderiaceae bacterium]
MIPTQGRMVRVLGVMSNGSDEQAAVITRAWSSRDTRDGAIAVNLTVLPDMGMPLLYSSVMLFDNRDLAMAWLGEQPHRRGAIVAFWPETQPVAAAPAVRAA